MEEGKFKFEPIWISALGIMSLVLIYKEWSTLAESNYKIDPLYIGLSLALLIIPCCFFLPMAFKMFTGVPAIILTESQLIDNTVNISIDWSNVKDIRIVGAKKPFLSITLKDRDKFFSNINLFKRGFLKLLYATVAGDVSINLAFAAGSNEAIAAVARVYWGRYYGIED